MLSKRDNKSMINLKLNYLDIKFKYISTVYLNFFYSIYSKVDKVYIIKHKFLKNTLTFWTEIVFRELFEMTSLFKKSVLEFNGELML